MALYTLYLQEHYCIVQPTIVGYIIIIWSTVTELCKECAIIERNSGGHIHMCSSLHTLASIIAQPTIVGYIVDRQGTMQGTCYNCYDRNVS